ncbi:MAG: hypothetical protein M1830_003086 [Pleopsidium flavum]|nr:MAG: hypothetical protein M1830_003086 [Pleopsidium flavum]
MPNVRLPQAQIHGTCVVWLTSMDTIKSSHFSFIVGDIPVKDTDVSSWKEIHDVAEQVNTNCVSNTPPGQDNGGIQRAGADLEIAVVVFGEGLFHEYLSILYGRNILRAPEEHRLARPGATA